jgi:hypothetical protein
MRRGVAAWVGIVLALAGIACADTSGFAEVPRYSQDEFSVVVLPVLLRDCGFHACHGSQERFFRVYGPGRVRLDPLEEPFAELDGFEAEISFSLAKGMIDPNDPKQSPLLRKPLAVEAGGSGHEGVDKFGRNVYRTPDDDGFLTLQRWVFSYAPQLQPAPGVTPPVP